MGKRLDDTEAIKKMPKSFITPFGTYRMPEYYETEKPVVRTEEGGSNPLKDAMDYLNGK